MDPDPPKPNHARAAESPAAADGHTRGRRSVASDRAIGSAKARCRSAVHQPLAMNVVVGPSPHRAGDNKPAVEPSRFAIYSRAATVPPPSSGEVALLSDLGRGLGLVGPVAVISEIGSGMDQDRAGLQAVLMLASALHFDAIVAWDWARLTRNSEIAPYTALEDLLKVLDVHLHNGTGSKRQW